MRKLTYLLLFLGCSFSLFAQGQWAYMNGNLLQNADWNWNGPTNSVLGSSMQYDANFRPGNREHGGGAGLKNGNQYFLYGGYGYGQDVNGHKNCNDVWVYRVDINQWAWIRGNNQVDNPDWGRGPSPKWYSQGSEDPNADPGGRNRMAMTMDASGNAWMFGGLSYAYGNDVTLNDLWKFNTNTNNWTYVQGPNWTNDGGSGSQPEARYRVRSWFDSNGDMWIYGGAHQNAQGFNDLWRYNVGSNSWTFVSGDMNVENAGGSYNGVGNTGMPRGRSDYGWWLDNSGNIWIYSGYTISHSGSSCVNDLWKYNISNGQWTLMYGDNSTNVNATSTTPGARCAPYCWTGNDGNLYMYGGADAIGFQQDMWMFNVSNNTWTMIGGTLNHDQGPSHNGVGNESPSNTPAALVAVSYNIKTSTHAYMYTNGYGSGTGSGLGFTGSMWRYSLTTPPPCNISSASISNQSCSGSNQSFSLTVNGTGTGSGYTVSGFPGGYSGNTTGTYGSAISFGTVPTSSFPLNLTITDNNNGSCTYNVTVNATSCPCSITSATVSNQTCVSNNQSFSLTVSGANTGSGYTVSGFPGGYSGNTTGTYGSAISFGTVPTSSFPLNLTITDNATGSCTYNVTVNATSCGTSTKFVGFAKLFTSGGPADIQAYTDAANAGATMALLELDLKHYYLSYTNLQNGTYDFTQLDQLLSAINALPYTKVGVRITVPHASIYGPSIMQLECSGQQPFVGTNELMADEWGNPAFGNWLGLGEMSFSQTAARARVQQAFVHMTQHLYSVLGNKLYWVAPGTGNAYESEFPHANSLLDIPLPTCNYNGTVDERITRFDYHPDNVAQFKPWLAAKYCDIANLNAAYGTSYATFNDVPAPTQGVPRSASGLGTIQNMFTTQHGRDWYYFNYDQIKSFWAQVKSSIHTVNPNIKLCIEFGSIADELAISRGGFNIPDINTIADIVKPGYIGRAWNGSRDMVGDLAWSNLTVPIQIEINENDPPTQGGPTDPTQVMQAMRDMAGHVYRVGSECAIFMGDPASQYYANTISLITETVNQLNAGGYGSVSPVTTISGLSVNDLISNYAGVRSQYNSVVPGSWNDMVYMPLSQPVYPCLSPTPNLTISITQDNFDPTGASPYTNSTREVTIQNTGAGAAQNVTLDLGLSPYYSYSAMQLSNVQVLDGSNNPVSGAVVTGTVWNYANDPSGYPCGTPANYNSTIHVMIPSIAAGTTVRVRAIADHCMANFNHPSTSFYTWNYWGAEGAYQDGSNNNYVLRLIENETAQTLQENNSNARVDNNSAQALYGYFWTAYQGTWSPISVPTGTQNFTIELGSGSLGSPSNYQDRGAAYSNSRTRLDLTLPPNVSFATNGFGDITAEYAVNNGSSSPLNTVVPNAITPLQTLPDGSRVYEILFPVGQHIAVRRMFIALTAASSPAGSYDVRARMRATYNNTFATSTYGWKPESPEYLYRVNATGLPVELLSFTGNIENENAELSWITVSEINNAGFEVEKSLNGTDFTKIAFVSGAGTTTSTQNYHFTDHNFSSRAWYRLNQVDYDGKATPSNVVELSAENMLVSISPNPLENGVAIVSLPAGENRKVAVYNAIGEKILEANVEADTYVLNLSTQAEGIYSLICTVDGKKQVMKVKR